MNNVSDKRFSRKRRNPSYPIAPHCCIKPRACYCLQKSGLKRCDVKAFTEFCAQGFIVAVLKVSKKKDPCPNNPFKSHQERFAKELLTEKEFYEVVKDNHE